MQGYTNAYVLNDHTAPTLTSAAWNTIDLSSYDASIPSTAKFAVLQIQYQNASGGSNNIISFRHPDSTEGSGGYCNSSVLGCAVVPIGDVAGNASIEVYVTSNAHYSIYFTGYFTASEATCFTSRQAICTDIDLDADAWETTNVSSLVPSTATLVFGCWVTTGGVGLEFATRPTGEAWNAAVADTGQNLYGGYFTAVANSSGQFDVWSDANGNTRTVEIFGYANATRVDPATLSDPSGPTTTTELTASSSDVSALVVLTHESPRLTPSNTSYRWRPKGSTDTQSGQCNENQVSFVCPVGTDNKVEVYVGNPESAILYTVAEVERQGIVSVDETADASDTIWSNMVSLSETANASDSFFYGTEHVEDFTETANASDAWESESGKFVREFAEISDTWETGIIQPATVSIALPGYEVTSNYNPAGFIGSAALERPFYELEAEGAQGHEGTVAVQRPVITVRGIGAHGEVGTVGIMTLPIWQVSGVGVAEAYVSGTAALTWPYHTMTAVGARGNTGTAAITMPSLVVYGEERIGTATVTHPGYSVDGVGIIGAEDGTGTGALTLPVYEVSASGLISSIGSAAITLPMPIAAGVGLVEPVADVALSLPVYVAEARGLTGEVGTAAITLPFYEVSSAGVFSSSGTATLTLPGYIMDALGVAGAVEASESGLYEMMMTPMNLERRAVTEWHNCDFKAMFKHGDDYFVVMSDGIYKLGGDDDNGTDIFTNVEKVKVDFGSSRIKKATDVYVNMWTSGNFTLKNIADASTASQSITDTSTDHHTKKVNCPKGLKGRDLGFGISNTSGSKMEIEEVEIIVEVSHTRRRRH